MTSQPDLQIDLTPRSRPDRTRLVILSLIALACLSFALFGPVAPWNRLLIGAVGATLLAVCLLVVFLSLKTGKAQDIAQGIFATFIEKDASPSFVTDEDGAVLSRNSAASIRFSGDKSGTLASTFRSIFANPGAVLYRLQCRAKIDGNAREDVVTRRGHVRLAVHLLNEGRFLWRFEDIADRGAGRGHEAVPLPMLTVGRSGAVLFMNEAARGLVGQRVKSLDRLFTDLPIRSGQIHSLSCEDGPVRVVVHEAAGNSARSELFLVPVDAGEQGTPQGELETLRVPMMKIDLDGRIRGINHLAAELVGSDAAVGTELGQIMQGLGRPIGDWLNETARGTAKQKSEFLKLSRKDLDIFVQVTLSLSEENGDPILIAVLNDATELKTLEAQFVQSQKMQAIGQLAGGVAHDFNNLLTAISGHCDLLLLRHDQGDPDYGDLVQINQNANRAAALVGQLLAFSRKQTLRPETLDLRDTLSDMTHLLNRLVGEKVTLTLSHDPVLKPVRADKRQLEQVLMNLVVNARDAMPRGGEIRIETEIVELQRALERDRAVVPCGEYVTVKVRDEGTGIAVEKLEKIFEPFFTTKRTGEGTGLGLSTVYGIIKQTGGYIFVDSVEGKGSEFILYFPTSDIIEIPDQKPAAAPPPPALKSGGEGVILLVEDEAPVRAFASRALRLRGYTVLEAESAEDALNTLEDPDLDVDVFVTDVVMPGLDGPSWVKQALQERPDVRVVFVSGYAEGAFGDSEQVIPNSVFLPKPFSLSQLTETVQQQIH